MAPQGEENKAVRRPQEGWNAANNNIANPRALAPQNTLAALTAHITNRTFDYDFEHIPVTPPHTELV